MSLAAVFVWASVPAPGLPPLPTPTGHIHSDALAPPAFTAFENILGLMKRRMGEDQGHRAYTSGLAEAFREAAAVLEQRDADEEAKAQFEMLLHLMAGKIPLFDLDIYRNGVMTVTGKFIWNGEPKRFKLTFRPWKIDPGKAKGQAGARLEVHAGGDFPYSEAGLRIDRVHKSHPRIELDLDSYAFREVFSEARPEKTYHFRLPLPGVAIDADRFAKWVRFLIARKFWQTELRSNRSAIRATRHAA